ncbi:TraR/DksA family transcriptional regulator [Streptomyces radicis]|uniref:Zinc finger DksA/TraR C4-type domain-containing protein n=1 Tax=Streptomyces radicis TaxID=1750517 RepID=A0A3A9WWD7_9ACTN|nr:TraR/DksA C4-type zinc finger protein [Streptomyces radicis]RKN10487.1 hypothetical protein D7319_08625 [Streptomyces radicis]RKN24746.1 hypothetical protein D7318_09800 [Streptomyces radicis]
MDHRLIGADNAGLPGAELAALRESLVEQRDFRLAQLAQLAGPGEAAPSGAASRREVQVALRASARMVLADVEAAIERMDNGSYGVCRRCGHAIALPRLVIVPQARYCAPCHRTREVGR